MITGAVVTGASSGVGRELALLLAREGVPVWALARRGERLQELASACGGCCTPVVCDLTSSSSCTSAVSSVLGGTVQPNVLVNVAGAMDAGAFHESSFESVEAQLRTNLEGPARLLHGLLPHFLATGSAQVVNVLSIAVKHVFPGTAAYTAAKAGLSAMTRVLAAEYRTQGVRFTSVFPGAINSELWEGVDGGPPREEMLTPLGVAEVIRDVLRTPMDRSIDEITVMPPKGIL